jgi:hypothetical protein
MSSDLTPHPRNPAGPRPAKNTIIIVAVLVVAAFLAGFLPSYIKRRGLESELRQATMDNRMSHVRDLAGLAYLQANQKNYGLAAESTARFFQITREVFNQTQDNARRKALEELLSSGEKIASELSRGDPAVVNDLQSLFVKSREATGADAQEARSPN